MSRVFPGLTLLLFLAPVAAGLIGTALPAFGYLPALGGGEFGLDPWRALWATPGIAASARLSLITGFVTTAVSVAIVVGFCAGWHGTRLFGRMQRLLSPLLAVPHVAVAFGFAFLLAPSGWLFRAFSPWATGFERPADLIIVQDPLGLSLAAGLVLKEVPFLLLMTLAALGQVNSGPSRTLARTLGYGRATAWLKAVLPQIYPQIRLPIFAVLAYATSVVDVALVLGPSTPPPLAVQLLRWFHDPDLTMRFTASAGALLQLALVVVAIAAWWGLERLAAALGRVWIGAGWRGRRDAAARWLAAGAIGLAYAGALASMVGMALWSIAGVWRYPDFLPARWTVANWQGHVEGLVLPAWNTISVGLAAAAIALVLTLGCLENEQRYGRRPSHRVLWLLYIPLLVPQVGFLFGAQVLAVAAGIDGTWLALVWSHLLFVLPYVFLVLADPYRALDERYARSALCLGASPDRVFWRVKLPMLLRPVLFALAVGFAVSVAQYLPTLFAGGGRFATLTTEAVALAGGADRRVMGVFAFLQAILPLAGFALALGVPAWLDRRRRALGSPLGPP